MTNAMKLCLAGLTIWLAGCPKDAVVPTPIESQDAGWDEPDAANPSTCGTWCANATKLGCAAAKPTPGRSCSGKACSCEAVCVSVQASGIVTWNLACRTRAKTCAAADRCESS